MKKTISAAILLSVAIPVLAFAQPTVSICPLLTDYLKLGGPNDPSQVAKLQAFLRDREQLNVTVSGTFDSATEQAVMAFQARYASEVLAPFGASMPTGFVHITTLKKINQLACGGQMNLTSDELNTITSIRARAMAPTKVAIKAPSSEPVQRFAANLPTKIDPSQKPVSLSTSTIAATSDVDESNADMAADPLMSRFGRFIVGLFK